MTDRTIEILSFCSTKGGVGKSTLAVVTAKLNAQRGRKVGVLDLDLTGSSLADGLGLCAPEHQVSTDDRLLMAVEPPSTFLNQRESSTRRWQRYVLGPGLGVPYINDAFLPNGVPDLSDLCPAALRWQASPEDGVLWFPSSGLNQDVQRAVELNFYTPADPKGDGSALVPDRFAWPARLSWLLRRLVDHYDDCDLWIVDLPPGMFGFSLAALSLCERLAQGTPLPERFADLGDVAQWKHRSFLIMGPERGGLISSLSHPFLYNGALRDVVPVINRCSTQAAVRGFVFTEYKYFSGIVDRLHFVEHESTVLAKIFEGSAIDIPTLTVNKADLVDRLGDLFRVGGEQ